GDGALALELHRLVDPLFRLLHGLLALLQLLLLERGAGGGGAHGVGPAAGERGQGKQGNKVADLHSFIPPMTIFTMPPACVHPNTAQPAIVRPPETLMTCPVMNAASSEARKATMPGMSPGWPTRFIGIARTSAS